MTRDKEKNNSHHQEMIARYQNELIKCMGKQVEVETQGKKVFKGDLIAYHPIHTNVVLMTKTHKIIIRNVSHIKRKRDYDPKKKK